MIPKIIHYCWFGGNPLPPLALECIVSWRKYLPDYKIIQWREASLTPPVEGFEVADEVREFDVNMIPYTAEAYRMRKYAFVSDYARFWIMYKFGGIYFDTDVEVIRSLDDIVARGNFMGFEMDPDGENTPGKYACRYCFGVNPGLGFGVGKELPFIRKMMDFYATVEFHGVGSDPWFKTIVAFTTEMMYKDGLRNMAGVQQVDDITIYPREYFAPINVITGRKHITENTRTIHRYMASWNEGENHSFSEIMRCILPECALLLINRIKRANHRIR